MFNQDEKNKRTHTKYLPVFALWNIAPIENLYLQMDSPCACARSRSLYTTATTGGGGGEEGARRQKRGGRENRGGICCINRTRTASITWRSPRMNEEQHKNETFHLLTEIIIVVVN